MYDSVMLNTWSEELYCMMERADTPFDEVIYLMHHLLHAPGSCKGHADGKHTGVLVSITEDNMSGA